MNYLATDRNGYPLSVGDIVTIEAEVRISEHGRLHVVPLNANCLPVGAPLSVCSSAVEVVTLAVDGAHAACDPSDYDLGEAGA